MARPKLNGKAETATTKVTDNLKALKRHVNDLKKVKSKCDEIVALKKTEVGSIIDGEIEKAKNIMRQLLEKELNEL